MSALVQSVSSAPFRRLRAANEKLVIAALQSQEVEEEAVRRQQRQVAFVATVAHELRNPLLPLRLAVRRLASARNDEDLLRKLQVQISDEIANLAKLIGDLLDGARASTGKFRLERAHVDLAVILAAARDGCTALMEGRRHRFRCTIPDEPLPVHADALRLSQVFANLLENAAKYTPEGGEVSLACARRAAGVEITVSDNGVGITAAALPHLFEMFAQDAPAIATQGGGLGIGLAVVHELVTAHGGTVSAYSAGRGLGSRFVVTLPLAMAG